MAYVFIILAVLALSAAAALWFSDSAPHSRHRRALAQKLGFDFSRSADSLGTEWTRGAAASGAPPRNVISGSAYGHDTHVMEIGGVEVVAMRTGELSDVVVDFRRDGFDAESSADLVEIDNVEGFRIFGTETGPVGRFIDVRVHTALEQFPAAVTAAWCESEWVLAQLDAEASDDDIEAVFAPLALLADAARVLPPHHWQALEFPYPTREISGVSVEATSQDIDSVQPKESARPDDPRPLPTRVTGTVRGVVEKRALGGDDVEAIASGSINPDKPDLTRVRRKHNPPSIFDD